jgi:hypothetical protein
MKINRKLLIVIIVVLLVGIAAFFWSRRIQAPPSSITPTPTPYIGVGFRGMDISSATIDTVRQTLGVPLREDFGQAEKTLVYPSGIDTRVLNVRVNQDGEVALIVEPQKPGTKWSTLRASLGIEDTSFYGHFSTSGYKLYVYFSKGTAALANVETDTVWEQWFFPPTTSEVFLKTIGYGYTPIAPDEFQE